MSSAPGLSSLLACAAATAIVFAAVKTWAPATRSYEVALGLLQWPLQAAGALFHGASPGAPQSVVAVRDPTDLVAIPFAGLGVLAASRRARRALQAGWSL